MTSKLKEQLRKKFVQDLNPSAALPRQGNINQLTLYYLAIESIITMPTAIPQELPPPQLFGLEAGIQKLRKRNQHLQELEEQQQLQRLQATSMKMAPAMMTISSHETIGE